MKYEIGEENVHNLMLFLNRVEIKGLKEVAAMNQVLDIFQHPLSEEKNKKDKK